MSKQAWVTLATNDSYGLGALVVAHSLRRVGSAYPAVVLITPSVTEPMRERLRAVFAEVIIVDVLDSRDAAHLALLQRPELGITFTKIHCWTLTQYDKAVFLDADTLVVQNCDELFEREELSAAPDVGWPDCFNSGVFVFRPSAETFSRLVTFASERGSFDGGDQGLLNSYFSDWAHGDINKHLPFLYNVTSAAFYSYLPALKHYGQNLKIIHFIGAVKPWLQQFNWESRSVQAPEHLRDFLQLWWDLFVGEVHSQLDVNMDNIQDESPATEEEVTNYREPVVHNIYYEPTLDPESEFAWHHPENQISDSELNVPEIDMSQYHDPWNIYRGNIPPSTEQSAPTEQTVDDYQDMRKYAWDYMPPQHEQSYYETSHSKPTSYNNYQYVHNPNDHHFEHKQEHFSFNTESQNIHHVEYHQHENYSNNSQQHSHYDNISNIHDNRSLVSEHQEPYHSHEHHYSHIDQSQNTQNNRSLENNQESQVINHVSYVPENPDNLHRQDKNKKHSNLEKYSSYSQYEDHNKIEHVYTVMMDHEKIRCQHHTSDEKVNGYESDSVSDVSEDIRPRHPYDGFYLRHRMTIDSRGKKICIHEIPHIPRSPTPDSVDEFEDAVEELTKAEEINNDNTVNDEESNTGVAGNLARVVPGVPLQREAIDELARRQGWEAGNIDYMGADSFDNIWAKISNTLSQPAVQPEQQSDLPVEASKETVLPPSDKEVIVETVKAPEPADVPIPVPAEVAAVEEAEIPVTALEALKIVEPAPEPVLAVEAATLVEESKLPGSDSPPLASTPSKEEIPAAPAAKSEERRRPAGKLQLRPPAAADPLPTPDSELEDAAALAHAIIASELRSPAVTAPTPPPATPPPAPAPPASPPPDAPSRLSVQGPEVPTPPVGAVSLSQIGVKPKPSTAALIESSVSTRIATPPTPEPDAPKKKLVKKAVKKDKEGPSSAEAPVPPPRKKEKKPKEK